MVGSVNIINTSVIYDISKYVNTFSIPIIDISHNVNTCNTSVIDLS